MTTQVKLGETDLCIAPVVLGGNVFGWTVDEKQSFKLLDHFTGKQGNCVDTADVYSKWAEGNRGGESETILGKWMHQRKNRHDIILATKVGADMGNGNKGLTKKFIFKACDDSLRRLKTEYIDLYQTHFDEETTPVEETLEAYNALITSGKVRYIGASNISPERLKESLHFSAENQLPSYTTLQPHYNLYARENYENLYEPLCMGHGLGVMPYYALQSGFLTGKYRSASDSHKSVRGGNMKKYLDDRGITLLKALEEVASELDTAMATVAIAWLIHRPSVTAPIASATSTTQLDEIMRAVSLELSAEHIRYLNSASTY